MKSLHLTTLLLVIVGGLNWGLVGLFEFDLVAAIFGAGSLLARLVYVLVGLSAAWQIGPLSPWRAATPRARLTTARRRPSGPGTDGYPSSPPVRPPKTAAISASSAAASPASNAAGVSLSTSSTATSAPAPDDRHHDLRAGARRAGDVAGKGVDVRRPPASGPRAPPRRRPRARTE